MPRAPSPPENQKDRDRFWPQATRETGKAGTGYSLFVRWMRLILPLIAVGVIGLLMAWPKVEDNMVKVPATEQSSKTIGKNELINALFESRDNRNQPFSITATRATQSAKDPDIVLLESPQAQMTLNTGTKLEAESAQGAYRQHDEKLLLKGQVKLSHSEGYELQTEKMLVNLETQQAWSDDPVFAAGPAGTLEASGMRADHEGNQLVFTGPVRLILNRSLEGLK